MALEEYGIIGESSGRRRRGPRRRYLLGGLAFFFLVVILPLVIAVLASRQPAAPVAQNKPPEPPPVRVPPDSYRLPLGLSVPYGGYQLTLREIQGSGLRGERVNIQLRFTSLRRGSSLDEPGVWVLEGPSKNYRPSRLEVRKVSRHWEGRVEFQQIPRDGLPELRLAVRAPRAGLFSLAVASPEIRRQSCQQEDCQTRVLQ